MIAVEMQNPQAPATAMIVIESSFSSCSQRKACRTSPRSENRRISPPTGTSKQVNMIGKRSFAPVPRSFHPIDAPIDALVSISAPADDIDDDAPPDF